MGNALEEGESEVPRGNLTLVDVCSGAGGLALGLEQAGFEPILLLDELEVACETLRANRPDWDVRRMDLREFDPIDDQQVYDVDLLSAGLPRVPAAATVGNARSSRSQVELIEATVMLMHGVRPRALLVENVPDLVTKDEYRSVREFVEAELDHLGYRHSWFVVNAADHGVPQDRRQGILIALEGELMEGFTPPARNLEPPVTVGETLYESMAARGWTQAREWAAHADRIAPTLVGGSWNRGGGDLGPSGTKTAWQRMGVNGGSLADEVPDPDYRWRPGLDRADLVRLTVEQTARLQGFPPEWRFAGRKTARYRQIGNASPPPVARALGASLKAALTTRASLPDKPDGPR
ncbi:DNA cytosine methyltransferase [Amycolatopsis magusensis]|uniref:DNA cytosine methyltransferase n=1 Tax=Amycolatopsis magusensis TaxID=882444 RepID=UPI0024A9EFC0|nr:DNA cytosine methyltransferase [Amycolatopsis magusensis]MDI5979388.1 DNA cytosine methyltransferase [Amycolatopsis magusensis]